ncbi:hypothetical protein BL254_23235 [Protofrankia sp. BMG5.30]|nr:hypothetical protein BL254_23235 [Protofrankia sp. BMG5.30]
MILSMFGLCFWVPFVAAISVQLKRIEGSHTPLTYAQLGLGATLPVAFFPPLYYFLSASFRPERSPESIQMLNDMGWLPFTGIIYAIFVQNLVIGIAVLRDKRAEPIFPRWYGYFNIWCALLYCPASLDVFAKTGPIAWNGLLTWWLSLVAFFLWLVVTIVVILKAITSQQKEHASRRTADFDLERAGASPSLIISAETVALKDQVQVLAAELAELRESLSSRYP